MKMKKLEIINELKNQTGEWMFYYYSSNPDHPPKCYTGENAKHAICNLLNLDKKAATLDKIISSFTRKFYQPFNVLETLAAEEHSLEDLSINLLVELYNSKLIDPYLYYRWEFMANGLFPFLFRGRTNEETMKSFRINYRKSLSKNCDSNSSSLELMKKLNDAFLSLGFGVNGVDLHEMISFGFVKAITLNELKSSRQWTINKYKRAL